MTVRVPICPICIEEARLVTTIPRDDGCTDWHFQCPVCKAESVVIEKATPTGQSGR
jgi:hypothetical protein